MKRKLLKIGAMVVVFLTLISAGYYVVGEWTGNTLRLKTNFFLHKTEFNEFASKFLNQSQLRNLAFNDGSQIINNCTISSHLDIEEWVCLEGTPPSLEDPKNIHFKDLDAVLAYQKVSKDDYLYYADFLKKYHLNGLGKDRDGKTFELSDRLIGLRYFQQSNTSFNEDEDYPSVEQIDAHWFFYVEDWN
jgi:hypothetical protein